VLIGEGSFPLVAFLLPLLRVSHLFWYIYFFFLTLISNLFGSGKQNKKDIDIFLVIGLNLYDNLRRIDTWMIFSSMSPKTAHVFLLDQVPFDVLQECFKFSFI
jgi:hypothetical protein